MRVGGQGSRIPQLRQTAEISENTIPAERPSVRMTPQPRCCTRPKPVSATSGLQHGGLASLPAAAPARVGREPRIRGGHSIRQQRGMSSAHHAPAAYVWSLSARTALPGRCQPGQRWVVPARTALTPTGLLERPLRLVRVIRRRNNG